MASTHEMSTDRFKPGDWVTFHYGTSNPVAQIAEARGALGRGGRRLYSVRLYGESTEPDSFEVAEEELELAVPNTDDAADYLKSHLVEILRHGNGGPNSPRVWLTYSGGAIIHTFEPARGLIGGASIPPNAFQGNRVFAPSKDDVERFVSSFGIDARRAGGVIETVGLAP